MRAGVSLRERSRVGESVVERLGWEVTGMVTISHCTPLTRKEREELKYCVIQNQNETFYF